MRLQWFGLACVLVLSGVATRQAEAAECQLGGKYPVRSVTAYSPPQTDLMGVTDRRLRGAELFVPAQPGLTREWLQRIITDQTASGECDFGMPSAKVSVSSASGGFDVRVTADDERAAAEILRHAEPLVK